MTRRLIVLVAALLAAVTPLVSAQAGGIAAQQAYLKASNTDANDEYGQSVAVSIDTIVVGANAEDSAATGVNGDEGNDWQNHNGGAAYVYVRQGTDWLQQAYLKASNTDPGDGFGYSVAIDADTIVVGAPLEQGGSTGVDGNQADNSESQAGAAYVFVRNGTSWSQQAYLKASNNDVHGVSEEQFGQAVAVWGNTVAVGAFQEDGSATGVDGDGTDNTSDSSGAA
ncbi:MAG: FG-GAP repeat protein [Planctomycetota bacterium]|jgi:hypothetical protein